MSEYDKPAPTEADDAKPGEADDDIPQPPDVSEDHVVEDPDRQGPSTEGA